MSDDPNADTIDFVDAVMDGVLEKIGQRLHVLDSNLAMLIESMQSLNERVAKLEHSKFESFTPVPVDFPKR